MESEMSERHIQAESVLSPAQEKESSNSGTSESEMFPPGLNSSLDAMTSLLPEFASGKSNMSEGLPLQSSQQDLKFFPGLGPNMNLAYDELNKVYVCHLCDFRTAFRNSLLNHQAVHSDLRPWVCAMCEYAAKRKQDLKKHLHTVHGMMVESTQLKPVMGFPNMNLSGSGPAPPNAGEGLNFWDVGKMGKSSSDFDQSTSAIMHSSSGLPSSRKMQGKLPPSSYESSNLPKQDFMRESMAPLSKMGMASASDPEQGESLSSPEDDDLPISFPASSPLPCKVEVEGQADDSQLSPGEIPAESFPSKTERADTYSEYDGMQGHIPLPTTHGSQDTKLLLDKFLPSNPSPQDFMRRAGNKRPRESSIDRSASYGEKSHQHYLQSSVTGFSSSSLPLRGKISRKSDSEDPPSCSSSTNVTRIQGSQTRQSFLCEFCDIMFFQRAMYLMHAGLHAAHNPWCCTVCNHTFTEKYSFTSHFINQH
ncbi:zinc finger protein Pegasus [Aplysia californica]|uniref:Zinc finger protein Pegasus n=1 Tax=Aplysia californica TaxID=6500 RepID=A0ABM1VPR8_APLCA|nr:zinc finger protein Pegasus [Aplysia californica]XP_035824410.1 zinc finger protein Pegasus [Aplysia californica]